jgi:hypothetical protein
MQQEYHRQGDRAKSSAYSQCKKPRETRYKVRADKQSSGKAYKKPAHKREACTNNEKIERDWNLSSKFSHVNGDQQSASPECVLQKVKKQHRITRQETEESVGQPLGGIDSNELHVHVGYVPSSLFNR